MNGIENGTNGNKFTIKRGIKYLRKKIDANKKIYM